MRENDVTLGIPKTSYLLPEVYLKIDYITLDLFSPCKNRKQLLITFNKAHFAHKTFDLPVFCSFEFFLSF